MSKFQTPTLSRRGFALGALSATTVTAACGNGVGNDSASKIDARVDATLNQMFDLYPNTRDLQSKATGLLVMPLITEAGFVFGGSYGRGALRINGATVDYYSSAQATVGFQIGAQQYAHALFFMTEEALRDFRYSSGWAAGADIQYAVNREGGNLGTSTTNLLSPVIGVVFGQAGLIAGATVEGQRYTRILP